MAAAPLCVADVVYTEPPEEAAARVVALWPRLACRRSYIGVGRGGVCVTDMSRRSYIGVSGASVTDLCRRSYIGVCRGGVSATDLCRRSYIRVCRGGVSVTDLRRRSYFGVCKGGVSVMPCSSFLGVCCVSRVLAKPPHGAKVLAILQGNYILLAVVFHKRRKITETCFG